MTSEYSICRTCGTRAPNDNMESIYNCQEIASKFKKLLPLNIVLDRRLSEFMCKPCIMELNLTHEFIEKALAMQKQQLDQIFTVKQPTAEPVPAATPEKLIEATQKQPPEMTEPAKKLTEKVPEKIAENVPEKPAEVAKTIEKRVPSPELILVEDEPDATPPIPPTPPRPQLKLKPISSLMNPSAVPPPMMQPSIPTQQVRPNILRHRGRSCELCFKVIHLDELEGHNKTCRLQNPRPILPMQQPIRIPTPDVLLQQMSASFNPREMVPNANPAINSLQQVVSSINPPTYSRAVASRHMQNAAVVTRPQYYPNPNTMTTTSFISVTNSTRIRPNFSQMTPQQNSGSSSYLLVQQQAPKNHPYLQRMLSVQQQMAPVQQQIAPAPQVPPTQVVNPVASAASSQKPNASMDDDSNSLEIVDVVETPRVLSTFSLAEAPLQVPEPLPEKTVVPAPMQPVVLNTELIKPGDASNSLNVKALLALWSNPDFNTSSIFDDKGKCTVLFNECLNSICQCSICRIFFLNQAEYLLHLTTDLHGKSFHKFFPCYACKINFSSLQLLKEHHAMGLHGNARWQYSCSLCPLFSSKEENVLKHMIKSHCYCPHCHSYLQKLRHIQLSKKRSKLESHKCLVCGLLVNRHAALAMLKCIKESEMVYVCNFCSISVSSRELLTQHFLQNHSFVFNGKTMEPFETPNLVPHFLPYVAEGLLPILPTSPLKPAEKEIAQSDVPTTAINITAPTPEKNPPVPTPEKINSNSRSQRDSSESTESTESVPSIKVEKEDPPVREKKKTDPGSIQYCCHECPASFNQFGDLISHAKQSHTKEHLKCSNCNRNFASRDSLDTHKCRDTSGKMVLKLIKMEDLQN